MILFMGAVWVGSLVQAEEQPMGGSDTTAIIGKVVKRPDGSKLGTIKDLVINWRSNGYNKYAVLSVRGLFGLKEDHITVPWVALAPSENKDYFVLNPTERVLKEGPDGMAYYFYDRSAAVVPHSGRTTTQSAHVIQDNIRSMVPVSKTLRTQWDAETVF